VRKDLPAQPLSFRSPHGALASFLKAQPAQVAAPAAVPAFLPPLRPLAPGRAPLPFNPFSNITSLSLPSWRIDGQKY